MTAASRYALVRRLLVGASMLCGLWIAAVSTFLYAQSSTCPLDAVAIEPGAPIQPAVDRAGNGASFCLRNGIHRAQAIRPRPKQRFYGEGQTVLNGSRLLAGIRREDNYWVASSPFYAKPKHGECLPGSPLCDQPDALFLDDKPLTKVSDKGALAKGMVYIDYANGKIYLAEDPTNRKLEATIAAFAFESTAADVTISNLTIEKYASPAQKGAIHAREGTRWTIANCEVRLNSGAGISIGSGSGVRNCDIHDNGQIGIEGNGQDIRIEDNRIWSNNIYGFDPAWEAGGAKIAESDGVVFRGNHVRDNNGPGLWCDIDCHNVVYEENLVESNQSIGIFHEISFKAVIRNNVLRNNGNGDRKWFWGADITLAASQDVEVTGNTITVSAGGCGIMLIDQGRRADDGRRYKTRNNSIHGNTMTFGGDACAGGVSDTKPDDENFAIITRGGNQFNGNIYRVPRASSPSRFVWDQDMTNWDGFRRKGLEQDGRLELF